MDSQTPGSNLTNDPLAWSWKSHGCLELQYVLIDHYIMQKKSV